MGTFQLYFSIAVFLDLTTITLSAGTKHLSLTKLSKQSLWIASLHPNQLWKTQKSLETMNGSLRENS